MPFQFDHLLHAVHDPEQTRRTFEERLGLRTVKGGEHQAWGTYNALAYCGLSYIEWIAIRNRELAKHSTLGQNVLHHLTKCEGGIQFALRTTRMDDVVAAWEARGAAFTGPVPGARTLPDGRVIRWRLLFPEQGSLDAFLLPFVIEWEESDSVRTARLVQQGALPQNAWAAYRMTAVHVGVRSLDVLQQRLVPYYGDLHLITQAHGDLGTGSYARFADLAVYFWEPRHPLLKSELELYGERPFQLDLVENAAGSAQSFDSDYESLALSTIQVHGLRVRTVQRD